MLSEVVLVWVSNMKYRVEYFNPVFSKIYRSNSLAILTNSAHLPIVGAGEKLFEKLSEEAKERLAIAISSLSNIKHQLVSGDIKISLLNVIRQRKQAFLDLMKIGNLHLYKRIPGLKISNVLRYSHFPLPLNSMSTDGLSENDQYKDNAKMSRLLQCREHEVMAVYHEKRLLEVFLTMSQKLDEFMTGAVKKENVKIFFRYKRKQSLTTGHFLSFQLMLPAWKTNSL